ncbi:MAG: Patatin-like phospholipase, partial [Myxococcales bacterium]|nr:Patatin-like phospholipase [Myxococcales bacterium]
MGGDAPTEVPFAFNARPARDCDLVMKGGITSGVVYPPAVLVLQQRFRFRCIGGTSAGAIAAAVTAAAEFARESAGFERLDVIRRQLASPGFLLGLFKPSEGTAGAFGVLMDLFMTAEPLSPALPMGKRIATFVLRATRSLSRRFPGPTWLGGGVGALVGAIPAILILLGFGIGAPLSALAHSAWAAALAVIAGLGIGLGTWGGGLLSGASAFVRVFIDTLPNANSFGLCRGYTTKEDKTVLTSWLTDQIDVLAGRGVGDDDAPLTFADLASKKSPDGAGVDVVLRMVTSNLSHGQPYVFPREGNIFL